MLKDECSETRYVRSLDEIRAIIEYAKLDEKDLRSESQAIFFSPNVNDNNIFLLELDDALLDYVTKGNSLIIRGAKDDHAVMCTKDATYTVKEAETSNCLLLFEDVSLPNIMKETDERKIVPREITGMFHTYLELSSCRPRLKRLRFLLEDNPYQGREFEKENCKTKYTFLHLLEQVQASENELILGLRHIEAFKIDGFWRSLEFDYKWRVLNHIINFVDENSWSYDSVAKQLTLSTLGELEPSTVMEQCLEYYATPSGKQNSNGQDLYQLNSEKICRLFAEVMLRQTGRFNLQEFIEAWALSVPNGMTAALDQLEGLVLIDRNSYPQTISHFPIWELPEDIAERFNFLFRTRSKWSFEEIRPFVIDLATEKLDANGLLTKFARASTHNGVRYYTPKRPIT